MNDVLISKTANLLCAMLEGCFRRTEASSLKMSNQRYDSIYKEVDSHFYDFVKVRLSTDEELRAKKSEFSVAEVIVKVVCENINSGELDTCYNIWKQFRDEKLLEFDNHFTQLRDLKTNIQNDMLVYFWIEYASNVVGIKFNIWWVIEAREDDGYLIFKDVFPSDLRTEVTSFSIKHVGKPAKTNKSVKQIVEECVHKNKGKRIMKEYGNKGAFGMNVPSPNSYGFDDVDWSISPLKDDKLRITKALPSGGSKSFTISVEDDGNTLNIIDHKFTTVKTVSKYLKEELNDLSKFKPVDPNPNDFENDELGTLFFTPRDPELRGMKNTDTLLNYVREPLNFKGFISHEDKLPTEGNIIGDLYSILPVDPESKRFFHYEEDVSTVGVVWTGLTWALYDNPNNPEKFKGFLDNVNCVEHEAGDKEDTILAYNPISKKYERYEHDGSGWVVWGLTSGSMKYSVPSSTTVSNHCLLPNGRFLKKDVLYIINSDAPLYQNGHVCLVNQREKGWINQEVIDRLTLSTKNSIRPVYVGLVYGDPIESLEQFNNKYHHATGDTISVKTKQNVWVDYVWDGEHWYEIPTNVPNVQFRGIIKDPSGVRTIGAHNGDVYFCISEKRCYIFMYGIWKPYFN